jgi:hypothetical protein
LSNRHGEERNAGRDGAPLSQRSQRLHSRKNYRKLANEPPIKTDAEKAAAAKKRAEAAARKAAKQALAQEKEVRQSQGKRMIASTQAERARAEAEENERLDDAVQASQRRLSSPFRGPSPSLLASNQVEESSDADEDSDAYLPASDEVVDSDDDEERIGDQGELNKARPLPSASTFTR